MSYGDTLTSVIKRDGSAAQFASEKIYQAIHRAGMATGEYIDNEAAILTSQVLKILSMRFQNSTPDVESIQDTVEQTLITNNYLKTFRAYSVYRENRKRIRQDKLTTIDAVSSINEYLKQDDWRVKANANQGYSLGGMILNVAGKVVANYWLSHVYPPEIGAIHRNGDVHIHDLDMLSGYTYFGKETIIVKYADGCIERTNFEMLYARCDVEEQLLNAMDQAYVKYPVGLQVLDKQGWTSVQRIIRKAKQRKMYRVSDEYQNSMVVTDNHPIITQHGEIEAKDITEAHTWQMVDYDKLLVELHADLALFTDQVSDTPFNPSLTLNKLAHLTTPIIVNIPDVDIYDITTGTNTLLVNGIWSHNCAGWSLRTLLNEGLNGVSEKVEAKAPKHMSSAVGQIVNFLGTLQNEWAGAQAFSSFDTYMAPFIRKDNLQYAEVLQCIQELIYNLNVPSRWGTQTPFTNLTFDWTCPDDLKDKHPLIGGVEVDFTYGDLQVEMDMINQAYIEVMTRGDAKGRVFTFPIPTYNITKDFPWESPNTDLLFEMTAKYGIPYFQNFINSDLEPNMVRSMCPLPGETLVPVKVKTPTGQPVLQILTIKEAKRCCEMGYGLQVWTGHRWANARPNEQDQTDVIMVTFSDNTCRLLGINHLQPTRDRGTVPAKELQISDEIPFIRTNAYGLIVESDLERAEWYHKKIVELEQTPYYDTLYCFEVDDPSSLFMLADGMITHNCRLQLDLRELLKRGNGLFGSAEQTGSCGVVTLNCARLGYVYRGDKKALYKQLDYLLELAKNSLELKRKTIQLHMDQGLFPYTSRYLGTLKNHFSTIGVNGINEMIRNFTDDQDDITSEAGHALAVEFLDHIRARMTEFQEETGHLYNLEATPGHEVSCRRKDAKLLRAAVQ